MSSPANIIDTAPGQLRTDSEAMLRTFSEPLLTKLDRAIGLLEQHPETFDKYQHVPFVINAGIAAGTIAQGPTPLQAGLYAKTILVDNPGGYQLFIREVNRYVPPDCFSFPVRCFSAPSTLTVVVTGGSSATPYTVICTPTESVMNPTGTLGNG